MGALRACCVHACQRPSRAEGESAPCVLCACIRATQQGRGENASRVLCACMRATQQGRGENAPRACVLCACMRATQQGRGESAPRACVLCAPPGGMHWLHGVEAGARTCVTQAGKGQLACTATAHAPTRSMCTEWPCLQWRQAWRALGSSHPCYLG